MPNHQGNQRNGRNVAVPDENRQSWRPQDDYTAGRARRGREERYDERYTHWEDRDERGFDPDEDWRPAEPRYYAERPERYTPERYGQGQSGYGAGRMEGDRAFQQRNQGYPGSFEDRQRTQDDRWAGRGGSSYDRDMAHGPYGAHGSSRNPEHDRSRQNLGVGTSMPTGYQGQPGQGERTGYGGHRGKGPKGYQRSDDRIRELVCEALTEHDGVDASEIEVAVQHGEVTLRGMVEHRHEKRLAEDVVEQITGVRDIHNQIRVGRADRGDDKRS